MFEKLDSYFIYSSFSFSFPIWLRHASTYLHFYMAPMVTFNIGFHTFSTLYNLCTYLYHINNYALWIAMFHEKVTHSKQWFTNWDCFPYIVNQVQLLHIIVLKSQRALSIATYVNNFFWTLTTCSIPYMLCGKCFTFGAIGHFWSLTMTKIVVPLSLSLSLIDTHTHTHRHLMNGGHDEMSLRTWQPSK